MVTHTYTHIHIHTTTTITLCAHAHRGLIKLEVEDHLEIKQEAKDKPLLVEEFYIHL